MAKTKTEIVKAPSAALRVLEPWEQELEEQAKGEAASESSGTPRITHKAGRLKIDGKDVKDNKLRCAIITYGLSKAYYEGAFDPSTPQTPSCYAFASAKPGAEAEMSPHDNSPKKQADRCGSCEHNKFGTAEKGKGKRCKDERRVLLVVETGDADSANKAEVRQINIPPGSLRNWSKFLNAIRDVHPSGNVRTVLTEISTEEYGGAYALTFKILEKLADDTIKVLMQKGKSAEPQLFVPYPAIEVEEKPKRGAKSNKKLD